MPCVPRQIAVIFVTILQFIPKAPENKPLPKDDPGFLQEITSTAVEVGLASRHGLLAISWKQLLVDGPPQP